MPLWGEPCLWSLVGPWLREGSDTLDVCVPSPVVIVSSFDFAMAVVVLLEALALFGSKGSWFPEESSLVLFVCALSGIMFLFDKLSRDGFL